MTNIARTRIGRVRLKGGADLHVLRRETPDADGTQNYLGEIIASARRCAEFSEPGSELCGYVVLGVYADGTTSVGWRYDGKSGAIPRALFPALVAETIRRDIITQAEAVEVFNRSI